MIQNDLFWEKHRPQTFEDAIILPRIWNEIKNGISINMIFSGSPGCGKTTLARILAKQYNYKELDISKEGGIETLRTKIDSFVNEAQLFTPNQDGMKIVYLEEFDKASPALQSGLRSYMETNSSNVRFIATLNRKHKIDSALVSRMPIISFNPQNAEERSFLAKGFAKRTYEIAKLENIDITPEDVKRIVRKSGTDFREILTTLQRIQITGSTDIINQVKGSNDDFHNFVLNGSNTVEIYNFLLLNYIDNPEEGIIALGQSFMKNIMTNHKDKIKSLPAMIKIYNDHQISYAGALDPLMVLFSLIENYQEQLL